MKVEASALTHNRKTLETVEWIGFGEAAKSML